jgi:rhamnogalacturonan acetylesterase
LESTLSYHDRLATLELGGPASNVFFVQHGAYAAQAQRLLGKAVVDANYPMDHTHTAPFLADVVSNSPCVHPKAMLTVV